MPDPIEQSITNMRLYQHKLISEANKARDPGYKHELNSKASGIERAIEILIDTTGANISYNYGI